MRQQRPSGRPFQADHGQPLWSLIGFPSMLGCFLIKFISTGLQIFMIMPEQMEGRHDYRECIEASGGDSIESARRNADVDIFQQGLSFGGVRRR